MSINSIKNSDDVVENRVSDNPIKSHFKQDFIKTGYGKILTTAIVTAMITSIFQFLLQKNQLSDEQKYLNRRYNIESIEKLNDQRIQLVDEINKELLLLEIKAKEIKLKAAGIKYYATTDEVKKLSSLVVQYHKDLYLNAAKVHLASFYFGNEVDSLIPVLGDALELNYKHNLLIESSGVKIPEFEMDFETLDTLTKSRNAITKAMIDEIVKSYELKKD